MDNYLVHVIIALALCLVTTSNALNGRNETETAVKKKNNEARLIEDLLFSYRHRGAGLSRPVEDSAGRLDVFIKFIIHEYAGIHDVTKRMKMSGLLKATWKDAYLSWDPANYGGLDVIPLRGDDIYLPVIVRQSSAAEMTPIFSREAGMSSLIWVDYKGNVYATVAGAYRTDCHLDLTLFPFDTQTCEFVFQVWQHSEQFVMLKTDPFEPFRLNIASSGAQAMWTIDSLKSGNRLVELELANFSAVVYTITTTRRATYYVWNLIVPCALLSSVQLAAFFMPYRPERVMFAVTLVLSLHLFQDSVARQLPPTAEPIPILKYTGSQMIIGILVTIESVMTIYILERMGKEEVPAWLSHLQIFFGKTDPGKAEPPKNEIHGIFKPTGKEAFIASNDEKSEMTAGINEKNFPPLGVNARSRIASMESKAGKLAVPDVVKKPLLEEKASAETTTRKIIWRETIIALDKAVFVACFAATIAIPASVITIM